MINLLVNEIGDPYSRENFKRLLAEFREQSLLKGKFKFFEITIDGPVTNFKYKHSLGFLPKDILQTSLKGIGTITWNYTKFDKNFLDITTSGSCIVRAFIGSYTEGSDA